MINKIIKHITNKNENFKFSILIPTWNNLKYLELCVNSIRKNSKFLHQIIIIINEGKDGTFEWVKNQNLDYIYSPENIGICYGLNIARSLIKTNYVIYMNDDMYVLPDWDLVIDNEISNLNTNLFMLSATMIEPIYTGNKCVVVKNYGENIESFDEKNLLQNFKNLYRDDWHGSTWPPVIMHIDTWDLVGGMSIEFSPGMYSDPDLSMKLWKSGVKYFKGLGKSLIYHFGSKSTSKIKKNKGKNQFLLKWGITSRSFTKNYLKLGQKFEEISNSNNNINKNNSLNKTLINKIKRALAALKN